ncbi:MAG: protein translocase subunit SecD, partial [Thermoguttaceae bacterium]
HGVLFGHGTARLGIDLSGGMILVYEVDQTKKKPGQEVDMDKLISAINRRINPVGIKEITIRQYGHEQIQIVIPEVDEATANRVAELVSQVGTLEFRILASTHYNKALIELALSEPNKMVVQDSEGNREAWWVPVREGREDELKIPDIVKRTRKKGNKTITEILVLNDDYDVTGDYLDFASPGVDPKSGTPCVNFTFNTQGGSLFGKLTGTNLPDEVQGFKRQLGIILDGYLYSAPGIEQTIYRSGIIHGSFTQQQVETLADVLNAGALPATLTKEPISRLYSGPTLGSDTIRKSTYALLYSAILVPLFMLWYYRFSGLVADLVLILNIVILFAIMITIKATFTLAGFAGLALTVGMAVDNNVLVFERLREELAKGAALRMAIRNAFQRAGATIVDCNITHLIAALVLYIIGNEQIKGFALTLLLGVTISMYTAVFVARVIFDIAEKHRWITDLKMHHLIGHTQIDFMSKFRYCVTFSTLLVVFGLAVAVWRGKGLFDIDFTGGVQVQTLFNEPQSIAKIRAQLEKMPKIFPDITISEVRFGQQENNVRFEVNTSNEDVDQIKDELHKFFGDKLVTNHLTVKNLGLIEPGKAEKQPSDQQPSPETKQPDVKPSESTAPPEKAVETDVEKHSLRVFKRPGLMAMVCAMPLVFGQVDATTAAEQQPLARPATKAQQSKEAVQKPAVEKADKQAQAASPPEAKKTEAGKTPQTSNAENSSAEMPTVENPAAANSFEKAVHGPENTLSEISDPFEGGTQAQLNFSHQLEHDTVVELIKKTLKHFKIEEKDIPLEVVNPEYVEGSRTGYKEWGVKIGLSPEKSSEVFNFIKTSLAEKPYFPASNRIGGAVAVSARYQALYALVASWGLIILYLWIRFQGVAFGLAAVIALVHDVLITLGAIAFSLYLAPYFGWMYIDPFKINLPIIAAFLTIIGYSVNDTIVVFDRIREVRGKDPNMTSEMVNLSINQTISRTLLTSLTVFIVVVILYFFGGQALRGFSFALIVGVITGTYSSIYVAAPILLWLIGEDKSKQNKIS